LTFSLTIGLKLFMANQPGAGEDDMVKKIVRISSIDLSDFVCILNIDNFPKLLRLQGANEIVLETDREYFLIHENLAYRCLKEGALPKMLRVNSLEVNPDAFSIKVCMEKDELLSFALKNNVLVFETRDQYLIPTDIFLYANKRKGGENK